jgi:hypothetical protein
MSETSVVTLITCPGCNASLDLVLRGRVRCSRCQWVGDTYSFNPRVLEVQESVGALPEEATCIHHPRKKAVAVCAGTGDYVCALCAIELNGQTYSAEYLNTAGKTLALSAFDRTLPRPDSQIMLYLLCCFIPYVNVIFLAFAFIWLPHAVFLYLKLLRARRENEILRRVVGTGRVIAIPILLGIFTLAWIGGIVAIAITLMNRR